MRHAPCQDFPACAADPHGSVTRAGSRKATGVRGQHLRPPQQLRPPQRQRGPTHAATPISVIASEAKQSRGCARDSGLVRSARNDARARSRPKLPKQRAEKARQAPSPSRRHPRPSDARHLTLLEQRAQGRPGAGRRPWSACSKKARGRTTGSAEITRPSLRDGVTTYTRSSRGPACWPRRGRHVIAHLASAPGCQNHATSSSHRDRSSARASPRCVPMRPPHPAPDVRDDREAPPQRDGMPGVEHYFG